MSPQTVLLLLVASLATLFQQTQACTCLAPQEPAYCNTDFFLLAQILSKVENQEKGVVRYRFKPLQVIADPKNVIGTRKVKQFHSSSASSACGVELRTGATYLVGGMVSPTSQRLRLDLCRSYVEAFEQPTWKAEQFKELMQNCNSLNAIEK